MGRTRATLPRRVAYYTGTAAGWCLPPVKGLDEALGRLGKINSLEFYVPRVHRPCTPPDIARQSAQFWLEIANRKQVGGFVVYAEHLRQAFGLNDNPAVGADQLRASIKVATHVWATSPTIVVLVPCAQQQYRVANPELMRALDGCASLVTYGRASAAELALQIIRVFEPSAP